ncbi:putative GMC oxidoreductase [Annulohypoxylon truncatum]|uniref:putative GMC oxidoreductase n=1 Tax=Annulohypoxylon truncatum TaxID=327061 RepID=UPI002008266A|nr:putative GMC oxidoreductase [Annulohypoxylon truncatum]KAI1211224.1 putative GMC oxidoreductase [Annulohypoxylon truncatum]
MAGETPDQISSIFWDYMFVGGGLAASVVSHRLHQFDPSLKILVVEAGPDASNRSDIIWPNSTNLIGGDFDWKDNSVNQLHLDGRSINLPNGKALGGGTVINGGGWLRGDKYDYDLWGSLTNDARWSYDGQLPYMRKTETFWNNTTNPDQHGHNGPVLIQSATSTDRAFPLRDYALRSWAEVGIDPLLGLDANAGNPLGVGELNENKEEGRREIASSIYPLDGITVLTNTLVEKVLVEKTDHAEDGNGAVAVGIRLACNTEIRGREIIVAAGAVRTPQVLMLSGVGPAGELTKHGIPTLVDHPDVGQNLADHGLFFHAWKVKDPSAGWAVGSPNPLFSQPQYGLGFPFDLIVSSDVRKEGLAAAIAEDEGAVPDPSSHPLLADKRTFVEHVFMYAGAADGSLVTFGAIMLLPTARGSVKLASADIREAPLIDPNFLGTAVDRYVAREAIKTQIKFAGSDATVIGREILNGEAGAAGFDEVLSTNSTDEYIDARIRAGFGTSFHPMGTAAMGKVVDSKLRVKGVRGLRVVDASVFPVAITGHLQVATYALAEQAAEIIYADHTNSS